MKFRHWNGIGFEHEIGMEHKILSLEWNMKFCHWDGMETDQENLQDLSTKTINFDHENECLTMNGTGFNHENC